MAALAIVLIAGIVIGMCFLVDKLFTRLFRSRAQHMSGMAVRVSKRYGIFGILLTILGIMSIITDSGTGGVLLWGGIFVLLMGICLAVYYLSRGIFYDGETFLVSGLGKKGETYYFRDIRMQRLYLITGGGVVIELEMENGKTVSLQSTMDGVYPFLDTAFAAWCLQKGVDPQSCDFHDPAKSWWFPHEEES